MLSILIISPSEDFRNNLRETLGTSEDIEIRAEISRFFSTVDSRLFNEIRTMEADIVIVDASPDKEQAIHTVENILDISRQSHIFVSGDNSDADLILRAMRAGAKEFLATPVENNDLFNAIERVYKNSSNPDRERRQFGRLFTFFSVKGGTGSTVISTNFAVNLIHETKKSTILVDLDLQLGSVSLFLGMKPAFNIVDVADNIDRMDPAMFQGFIQKHSSGLDVLTAPDSLDKVETVGMAQVAQILEYLKNTYKYVVVDTSNSFDSPTVEALDQSSTIFLISNTDISSLRNTQHCFSIFKRLGYSREKLSLIINRFHQDSEIHPKDIEKILNFPIYCRFPNDWKSIINSINSGVPLTTDNNSTISTAFGDFVHKVTGLQPQRISEKKKGFFGLFRN